MNRRDMIIAAAIVNVSLLVILVATSIKRETKRASVTPSPRCCRS